MDIDHLSDYVIIVGNTPSHTGSGSKQSHVAYSEPTDTSCKHWVISINKHFLTVGNKYVTKNHITFILSVFYILKT